MLRAIGDLRLFPKLAIPIVITSAVMAAIAWSGINALEQVGRITHDITERQVPGVVDAIDARNLLNEAAVSAQNLIFNAAQNGVDPDETQFSALLAAASAKLSAFSKGGTSEDRSLAMAARAAIARYGEIQHHVFALSRGRQNAQAFTLAGSAGQTALTSARNAVERVTSAQQAGLALLTAKADGIFHDTRLAIIIGALTGATIAIGLLWIITIFEIVRPLTTLTHLTHRVADGDPNVTVQGVDRRDEIGTLARALEVFRRNAAVAQALAIERERVTAELEVAKNTAEAASMAKTDFLANMSHELRTPLNAIIGFCELMQSKAFGPIGHPKYEEYLTDIDNSGRHLLGLISDILYVTKINRGEDALQEELIELSSTLLRAIKMAQPLARVARVTIRLDSSPQPIFLNGDGNKIEQIFERILSNAIKFSTPDSDVNVIIRNSDRNDIIIAVMDRGIGILAEHLGYLATPFFQVESGFHRHHHGAGLGLAIAKQLVEMHGGTLAFQSAPGVGTTVEVRLPNTRRQAVDARPNITALPAVPTGRDV